MFNGTKNVVDIVASGAAWTVILSTGPVVFCRVKESQINAEGVANVPVGFAYQLWLNNTRTWGPTMETIPNNELTIGDEMTRGSRHGSPIGQGPQTLGMGLPPTAATPLFRAMSLAAATALEVGQFYS